VHEGFGTEKLRKVYIYKCKFDNIMRKTDPGVEMKSVVQSKTRQTGVTTACDECGFKVIYGLRTAKT
jgi:DNA-directed RNA polymerase subunit RPC12/RpoP